MLATRQISQIVFSFLIIMALCFPAGAFAQDREVPQTREQVMLSYAPLVREATQSVVNVYTTRTVQVRRSPLFDDPFFRRFFGDSFGGMPEERVQGSLGSGVIVGEDGIIVTNNHVIGEADSIRVVLHDRREFEAEVILADERTDLAVLRIDTEGEVLPAMAFTDSDTLEVGDIVLAIGNPFGVGQTVTSGIISATARTQVGVDDYGFFIQTDAAINPGNSGGALVSMTGELAGINSAIYSRSGGSNGIGFAIPANMVRAVVQAALSDGKIERPWLGASGQPVDQEIADSLGLARPGGVILSQIYPGGPADRAGLLVGDVIIAVNGREVIDSGGLEFRIATAEMGQPSEFLVIRNNEQLRLMVTLEVPPEDPPRNIQLIEGRNPFQGVTVANLSPRFADEIGVDTFQRGVIVLSVDRRYPAGRQQFVVPGDIIRTYNGQSVDRVEDLMNYLEIPAENYIYELRRGNRDIECGILNNRSFYCR